VKVTTCEKTRLAKLHQDASGERREDCATEGARKLYELINIVFSVGESVISRHRDQRAGGNAQAASSRQALRTWCPTGESSCIQFLRRHHSTRVCAPAGDHTAANVPSSCDIESSGSGHCRELCLCRAVADSCKRLASACPQFVGVFCWLDPPHQKQLGAGDFCAIWRGVTPNNAESEPIQRASETQSLC
jgi:hypothetical protein